MIPCYWVHYVPGGKVRCRWDEQMLDRIISGLGKRPGWFPRVVHHETMAAFAPSDPSRHAESCIVMFPAGDHDESHVEQFNADLAWHRNPVVFFTSDEGSLFPVHRVTHPEMRAFVMTPRSDREYPPGSFFIGEGDADAGSVHDVNPTVDKLTDVFFSGQTGHPRREQMMRAASDWLLTAGMGREVHVRKTPGFLQGSPRDRYLELMAQSKIALCPAGTKTQDSFRVYEALTYGCVPILDAVRNDGEAPYYWDLLNGVAEAMPMVEDWSGDLESAIRYALDDWPKSAVRAHEWWHWHRRRLALHLALQLTDEPNAPYTASDKITVIIPTSPIPSHPSTAMIESTISSVRRYLDSEILIMVDGVRPEQEDRAADYWEYVRRLMLVCERADNVTPIVSWQHIHQSGLMARALDHVQTPFVMFVEHDTPLDGQPIDFEGILRTMDYNTLNLMRFYHESHVLDEHRHLFLDAEVKESSVDPWSPAPYVRTMQWSQRPHLARTSFYRRLMAEYFAPGAKTMIEDVLHGATEFAHRKQDTEWPNTSGWGWNEWRLAVYAPSEGGMRRSLHLDGRDGDPKFGMTFAYPGDPPKGAPYPGTR